jgi:hypothetical protein
MRLSVVNWVVALLLTLNAALLAFSAAVHSPVVAEVNHLPAGLSHLYLGRFDLLRVNPPLVRTLAAVPVMLMSPVINWERYDPSPLDRQELDVSLDFLKANGSRSTEFFRFARWACIPFSTIGGYACFNWARQLYGLAAGLVSLTLWCFCPYILGHGSLITPDVPAAAMGVTASYFFWRWLNRPSFSEAYRVGIVLGLAELTKFTLLILYPAWVLTWLIFGLLHVGLREPKHWLREGAALCATFCLSIVVINLGYGCEGSFQPICDYRFRSDLFTGSHSFGRQGGTVGNRLADTWVASLPVPFPANYVQGIDAQRLDFERGLPSYLNGEWSEHGWWYYYLYALAIKVPLGTWGLAVLALAWTALRLGFSAHSRDEVAVCAPLLFILIFVSSQTGFSVHSRYIIPALPFLFIFTSRVGRVLEIRPYTFERLVMTGIVSAGVLWSVGSSLWFFPHSVSYFNELGGGPIRGHAHLLDSNIAWGQDLYFLKQWCDEHPEARPLHLACYTLMDPRLAGIAFSLPQAGPASVTSRASRSSRESTGPLPGWYAIDVNHLHGAKLSAANGEGGWERLADERYDLTCFQCFQPTARAGYSIYIYSITMDEANRVRRKLGLKELDDR